MDRVLKDKQVLDRQRQDKLISTVSQTLTSAVHAKLEKVVKSEMKNQVTPGAAFCICSHENIIEPQCNSLSCKQLETHTLA